MWQHHLTRWPGCMRPPFLPSSCGIYKPPNRALYFVRPLHRMHVARKRLHLSDLYQLSFISAVVGRKSGGTRLLLFPKRGRLLRRAFSERMQRCRCVRGVSPGPLYRLHVSRERVPLEHLYQRPYLSASLGRSAGPTRPLLFPKCRGLLQYALSK